ncbi:helix-turn-helix transcriptional regulator [Oceanibium sediminis]|uniref:helix-turn-helix transcriptional regulator n=1 Tax=Oceanibium sediminis TaxID=2026339 RepID=UPI000DD2F968|nr:helix-turn-helix transcriptional regulator [Oceanibium sediminis]
MRQRGGVRIVALWALVPLQLACMGFFVWEIGADVLGFRSEPISWAMRELIEIGAALGLVIGFAIGLLTLVVTLRHNHRMEGQLRAASGAFAELLEERFQTWGLTPAERDVAWFTLKGFSNAEIARLRETSEGTVKAQGNAIYRKAGVSGRTQLLSLFIEDMLERRPGTEVAEPPAPVGEASPLS